VGLLHPTVNHSSTRLDFPGELTGRPSSGVEFGGYIRFSGGRIYARRALRGHRVGRIEADADVCVVNFAGRDVGLFDPGDDNTQPLGRNDSHIQIRL
jgi:hypothetical protein